MDFTETYIKMCDHPKIQDKWDKKDNEYSISYKNKDIWISHEGNFTYKAEIWLPRQDQIQEMFNWKAGSLIDRFHWFLFEANHPMKWDVFSMEQLWLIYYMHEKHNLIWDGEKWKKK